MILCPYYYTYMYTSTILSCPYTNDFPDARGCTSCSCISSVSTAHTGILLMYLQM